MNANVSKLLNEQINKEFYSAYLYLDFANYYASVGLDGFENWYRVQAQEERDHAMLFYQYLQNNSDTSAGVFHGTHVTLQPRALRERMIFILIPQSIATIWNFSVSAG